MEYAFYLLRQGETDKIPGLFKEALTLSQLYPERTVFHISEWRGFYYVMSCYFIQIKKVDQANIYLQALEKMAPDSKEVQDIKRKMCCIPCIKLF